MSKEEEVPKWAEALESRITAIEEAEETKQQQEKEKREKEENRKTGDLDFSKAVENYAKSRREGYEGDLPGRDVSEDPYAVRSRMNKVGGGSLGGKEI